MKGATIIVILLVYMAGMLYIGWKGSKNAETFDDYLTAGKKGKLHLIVGSYLGGHLGTGIVVGGAAYGVSVGIGGAWYGLGAAGSFILFGLFVSRWAYRNNYLTIPAYLRDRYPETGKMMSIVWALLGAAVAITTLCSQIIAGRALFEYLGIDPLVGTLISVAVICIYCSAAGMFGVIATDFIQSSVILVGLVIALFVCFSGGGWEMTKNTLDASHFDWVPFDLSTLTLMFVPTALYGLTQGASMQLTASSDSEKTAFRGAILGGIGVAIVTFMPVFLGMYGAAAFPDAAPNTIIFTVIIEKLPALVAGLMMAAIVAAVMSTCDTTIMTIVTSLVYDAYGNVLAPLMGKTPDQKNLKRASSVMGWVLMALATILSFTSNDIIGVLGSGYTIWVAGGMIPFIAGRMWKGTTAWGALASMAVGSLFAWFNMAGITHFPTSLFCLIPAAIAVVVVSLLTRKKVAK